MLIKEVQKVLTKSKAASHSNINFQKDNRLKRNIKCFTKLLAQCICHIFDGMQYAGKAETTFNMRLINHRIDVKSPYSETILGC